MKHKLRPLQTVSTPHVHLSLKKESCSLVVQRKKRQRNPEEISMLSYQDKLLQRTMYTIKLRTIKKHQNPVNQRKKQRKQKSVQTKRKENQRLLRMSQNLDHHTFIFPVTVK